MLMIEEWKQKTKMVELGFFLGLLLLPRKPSLDSFFGRVWADKQSSPGHDGKEREREKKKLCNSRAYPPVLKCSLPYLHLNCMCFEDSRMSLGLDMNQGFLFLHCQTVSYVHVYLLCACMYCTVFVHTVTCKA